MKRSFWSAVILSVIASFTVGVEPAFAGATYSFTTAGATGRTGPTQAQINTAYSGTTLAGQVIINTQGIQEWTVPSSGRYSITVAGGAGGTNSTRSYVGGGGATLTMEVTLTGGDTLKIVVGQRGTDNTSTCTYCGASGGGGSFVYRDTSTFLAVAGGGGGAAASSSNLASTKTQADGKADTTSGTTITGPSACSSYTAAGGTSGNGGSTSSRGINFAGPGAGILTAGGSSFGAEGQSLSGGWIGGLMTYSPTLPGGFGGGGASGSTSNNGINWAGGGGGYSGGGGGFNSGCSDGQYGGGGGSFYTGTLTSSSNGSNTSQGYVTITSLGPSITTFAPTSTLTNSTSLSYNLVFSEAVTGLASGDFSLSGTGSSTCATPTVSGSGTTYTVSTSGCSPGTVVLTIAANAVTNAVPQTAPASNTAAPTVTIDTTAPTISAVTAPSNSTYIPGNTPTFTVAFSESVTVTGSPRLTLTVGSATKYASFVSLTDSKTATFRYTVGTSADEFDTDGIAIATSLDLNGGSISDLATNSISNLSFTAPALTSVLIAQPAAAPTIDSISATSGTLTIYFTAGAARGSTTSNYQYSTNNGSTWTTRSPTATTSPLTIGSLTDGTAYTIRLRAITNAGNSDSSTAVTETPTAISVSGDATLVLTYGNSASTSAYSALGGTNTFTWSLGSAISGITLSGTTVTASSSLAAGTYTQSVRATDGASRIGTKTLTITVNKASTSISIALPSSATTAAASGTVVITATVSEPGSVNFKLGGSTISGCASQAAASTTATCSWTAPGTLGNVSLTADFTPTDSSNYETSTTTTLTINIVNGVSTVTLSLAGGVTQAPKGQAIIITAVIDQAGKIAFYADGKRIPGCINRVVAAGSRTCSWKPATQKQVTITVTLDPTNNVYQDSRQSMKVLVVRRSGLR